MTASPKKRMGDLLDRLEAAYGSLVPSEDPVEAGLMTLLAAHAPNLSTVQTRQALREWFVDWNEMRVADPWDIMNAIGANGDGAARAFARAAVKCLRSLHGVLNRCKFDLVEADPESDVAALVARMRGAPPATKVVMLAVLARDGTWRPDKETSKLVQKIGLSPKTSSLAKVGRALAEQAAEGDRMRAHYLLARYAHRSSDDDDPLAPRRKKAAAKKAAPPKKSAAKKTASKKTAPAKKAPAKKPAAKTKTAPKKSAAKKAPASKKASAGKKTTARKKTAPRKSTSRSASARKRS